MSIPKNYYLMIDTETAGELDAPLVYDYGGAVVDNKGRIIQTFSLVISDVFYGMPEKMESAYYAEKLPEYHKETTKPVGKGTGMGLAMVYGTVTHHQGWIQVASSIGNGSTFCCFFPMEKQIQISERI